jgi:hypothetical protein
MVIIGYLKKSFKYRSNTVYVWINTYQFLHKTNKNEIKKSPSEFSDKEKISYLEISISSLNTVLRLIERRPTCRANP